MGRDGYSLAMVSMRLHFDGNRALKLAFFVVMFKV